MNGMNALPVHIIFASIYLPTQHLLNVKESDAEMMIFDFSVKKFPDAVKSHFDVIGTSYLTPSLTTYLVAPSCLDADILEIINRTRTLKPDGVSRNG